ncbi:MAG: ATP-dependent Clp protease ATP-binding subunit, partial [Clostridia bacterium]|nr:ATP-dependent Clp protease ATP-binding subunit [Clostridia bacterium]
MVMCSRCHKRMAVVFLTKIENGETKQEGLCIRYAKELGIKPINDILAQTGLDEEAIDKLGSEMEEFLDNPDMNSLIESSDGGESDGRAPILDFQKIINEGLFKNNGENLPVKGEKSSGKDKKDQKSEKKKGKDSKFLGTYTQNLTEKAREGKLDAIVGRDRELQRMMQILCRRQKNNPCLIGEPGVGKTAIAEALAMKIADGDVPFKLRDHDVCLLDLTALVAGTQFRGQFESRVLGLLNEVKERGNVILVIDEVHNIVGAGDAEGSMNAANILKPALSRGEIQIIGATTMTEYRKHIEKDSALERRFQPITVNEPNVSETVEILRGIKHYYEKYHGVGISDAMAYSAARLSERYITDRYLPDKAIDLIDEAASHVSMNSPFINERHEIVVRQKEIIEERERLEAEVPSEGDDSARYCKITELRAEELRIEQRIAFLDEECGKITLRESDLADVIEIWTGIPASDISENDYERLEKLEERISRRIIGQPEAVKAVSRAVRRGRAGVSYKRKPISFIFAGPTGVGKTELVKVLSEDLFSSPETLIRLDMSEFMEKHSVSRIIGSPPGYVGY